jgi:DNA polymerase III subunit delta'
MVIQSHLYGNSQVWHNLVNDSLINKVAHAYLFAGPAGIGKATTAREYIKYLLDANKVLANRVDRGDFLDLLYISKQDKNEIGIDIIRKAGDFFRCTPAEGTKKFIIIDSADDLNRNAANALLKILEEPTKNTYLFLISHSPSKLLATIRSRCRLVKFNPLDIKDLNLATNMNKAVGMEDFIAGSVSKAIACDEMEVNKLYLEILELITNNDIIALNKFSANLGKQHDQWKLISELLIYILNRCMKIVSNCLTEDKLGDSEREMLLDIAIHKTASQWFEIYQDFINQLREAEIYNLDRKQILLFVMSAIRR